MIYQFLAFFISSRHQSKSFHYLNGCEQDNFSNNSDNDDDDDVGDDAEALHLVLTVLLELW